jgi:hypothetical protein
VFIEAGTERKKVCEKSSSPYSFPALLPKVTRKGMLLSEGGTGWAKDGMTSKSINRIENMWRINWRCVIQKVNLLD